MEWFSQKTSIAGIQISNWILVSDLARLTRAARTGSLPDQSHGLTRGFALIVASAKSPAEDANAGRR